MRRRRGSRRLRFEASDEETDARAAATELGWIELGGSGRRAVDELAHPDAIFEQFVFFGRMEQSRGEAGLMEGGPEAVAGPGEMAPRRAGIQPGIDADEENVQLGADDVGDGFLAVGRGDFGAGGLARRGHGQPYPAQDRPSWLHGFSATRGCRSDLPSTEEFATIAGMPRRLGCGGAARCGVVESGPMAAGGRDWTTRGLRT